MYALTLSFSPSWLFPALYDLLLLRQVKDSILPTSLRGNIETFTKCPIIYKLRFDRRKCPRVRRVVRTKCYTCYNRGVYIKITNISWSSSSLGVNKKKTKKERKIFQFSFFQFVSYANSPKSPWIDRNVQPGTARPSRA